MSAPTMDRVWLVHPCHAIALFVSALLNHTAQAQEEKVRAAAYDGIFVGGYVDEGAYVNFTGPNVNLVKGRHKVVLGMMPSLRIKEDKGTTRNALVTPSLGCGVTYCYRRVAVQVPFYYNPKTATTNGRWHVGLGLGIRLK